MFSVSYFISTTSLTRISSAISHMKIIFEMKISFVKLILYEIKKSAVIDLGQWFPKWAVPPPGGARKIWWSGEAKGGGRGR